MFAGEGDPNAAGVAESKDKMLKVEKNNENRYGEGGEGLNFLEGRRIERTQMTYGSVCPKVWVCLFDFGGAFQCWCLEA